MKILVFQLFIITILINSLAVANGFPDGNKLVKAEIISDYKILKPGMNFNIGVVITPDKDWHTYWRNPGDAGLPTVVDLELPDGVKAGEAIWEIPEKIYFAGMANFGYDRSNMLTIPIEISEDFTKSSLEIKANVSWLVCKEECVPGRRLLSLEIPVNNDAQKDLEKSYTFSKSSNQQAVINDDVVYKLSNITDDDIAIEVTLPDYLLNVKKLEFYPYEAGYFNNGEPQVLIMEGNKATLKLKYDKYREKNPEEVFGLLVSDVPFSKTLPNKAIIIRTKI